MPGFDSMKSFKYVLPKLTTFIFFDFVFIPNIDVINHEKNKNFILLSLSTVLNVISSKVLSTVKSSKFKLGAQQGLRLVIKLSKAATP